VFSAFSTNILTKALQAIDQRDELKIVADQISCPTSAVEVAKALITITDAILKGKSGGYGTLHLCGTPPTTRFEFTQEVMRAYAPYTTQRPVINAALSSDFPGFALRPPYSVLDCTKLAEVYGIKQRPWRDSLSEAMQVLMRDRRQVA
jgi:dTDP-4-dehydrorhamnose reductase